MKTLLMLLLLTTCAYAETFLAIAPLSGGRPPMVTGDYSWSCIGRCDAGQKDSILQITATDKAVIDALKATKDIKVLSTDEKTGEVYEEKTLLVLKPLSLYRLDTKPIAYEAALKVKVEEEPKEELKDDGTEPIIKP